jgi:hypothetical protein
LDDIWRELVREAGTDYDRAWAQLVAALHSPEEKSEEVLHLVDARRQCDDALEEYERVLRIFHDLIVFRLSPPGAEQVHASTCVAQDVYIEPESQAASANCDPNTSPGRKPFSLG